MKKKIIIKNIKQKQHDNILEVMYNIVIRENEYNLTYKISGDDINTVPMLCDTAVVTLLVYAVQYGLSFYSEYPISEKLYYNLTKHVIPQLSISNKTTNNIIQIDMPITKEVYNGKWVGTGISMGVDSFATIHEYNEECSLEEYKLTHLVHLKTGAHHGRLGYFNKQKENELFAEENARVTKFCKKYNYKLLVIETNLLEVTIAEFGYHYDTTHTFRNLGCILLLQNKFNKYYYAASYNMDEFGLNLNDDVAHYEKWLMPYISNDNLEFYSSNTSMSRFQKTEFISNFEDTYDNLHVCWHEKENCGHCKKCIRTLVTLDVLGVLDKYSNSFNLDYYYKNRDMFISKVILMRHKDSFYMDIYRAMIERKYQLPSKTVITKTALKLAYTAFQKMGLGQTLKVVIRKMFR